MSNMEPEKEKRTLIKNMFFFYILKFIFHLNLHV